MPTEYVGNKQKHANQHTRHFEVKIKRKENMPNITGKKGRKGGKQLER